MCVLLNIPGTETQHLKMGLNQPKGKPSIPSIHFQVQAVSFREGIPCFLGAWAHASRQVVLEARPYSRLDGAIWMSQEVSKRLVK